MATGTSAAHEPVRILEQPGQSLVLGHRGAPARSPENTIPSFQLALAEGADAIEMDVRVSCDGIPVVFHDPTTGRTCGEDLPVAATAAVDLGRLDASRGHAVPPGVANLARGEIPRLDDALEALPGVAVLLELKTVAGQEEVRRVLDRHRAWERVMAASAIHGALRVFRDGRYRRAASRREIAWWWARSALRVPLRRTPYQALSVPPRKGPLRLTANAPLRSAARAGVPVHAWTIDDAAQAVRLWRAGVTGIITNDPASMVRARKGLGP